MCKPRTETLGETNLANTLFLKFMPPSRTENINVSFLSQKNKKVSNAIFVRLNNCSCLFYSLKLLCAFSKSPKFYLKAPFIYGQIVSLNHFTSPLSPFVIMVPPFICPCLYIFCPKLYFPKWRGLSYKNIKEILFDSVYLGFQNNNLFLTFGRLFPLLLVG